MLQTHLVDHLAPLGLNLARVKCLALLVAGLLRHRTVNFSNPKYIASLFWRNSKLNVRVNSRGKRLRFVLIPGPEHEMLSADQLLGGDLFSVFILLDKCYVSEALAAAICEVGAIPMIPPKKGAKNPWPYDPELGKHRHIVENFFARIKRSRRMATRHDRLAVILSHLYSYHS